MSKRKTYYLYLYKYNFHKGQTNKNKYWRNVYFTRAEAAYKKYKEFDKLVANDLDRYMKNMREAKQKYNEENFDIFGDIDYPTKRKQYMVQSMILSLFGSYEMFNSLQALEKVYYIDKELAYEMYEDSLEKLNKNLDERNETLKMYIDKAKKLGGNEKVKDFYRLKKWKKELL